MAQIVCMMDVDTDRATFTWCEGPASFEPYSFDRMVLQEFKESAEEAREKLAFLVADHLFDQAHVSQAAYELARAGYDLYEALFSPGADQQRQAQQVRTWLEQLDQEQAVDSLEIVVESPWLLPWNVIYDRHPEQDDFVSETPGTECWRPFWGLRYNLCGGRKVDPLRRMPVLRDPHVLLVVDPEVRDGLPSDQQQRLTEFAQRQGLNLVTNVEELAAATRAERPDLLYWLSHAAPDGLILAGQAVSPRNLRRLLRQDRDAIQFGGLAFLNGCQTAEGVGDRGTFFEALHSVGFAGMIGTEHQTIDQFANPLGLDFLEAFLDRGETVGSVLHELRRRVPLGLLYGTYCPPDIHVERGGSGDLPAIRRTPRVEGALLSKASRADAALPPLPAQPYRSLAYFAWEDRALFAGRDLDGQRFARMLDDRSTRILVLHGEIGVGKSSFLHAGVVPYLEEECLGYQFLRGRTEPDDPCQAQDSRLIVRCTNHPFCQLSKTLFNFCAQSHTFETPLGETIKADLMGVLREFLGDTIDAPILNRALREDRSLLGGILAAISDRLPFAPVLVVDQCEELFTLSETSHDALTRRLALEMFRLTIEARGDFKLILSLRTEYYGRMIDGLRRGLEDTGGIREYLLTELDEHQLLEAIRRPTLREPIRCAAETPFDKYGFRYAEGVAEQIAREVLLFTSRRHDSVLPLLQVICTQLYDLASSRDKKVITGADLESVGGIEGGLRQHVDALVRGMTEQYPSDRTAFRKLFTQLYLRQPDNTLTTALLPVNTVSSFWTGRLPFPKMLQSAESGRLLRVDLLRIERRPQCQYLSLGHDSLAKIASEWDGELAQTARHRRMTMALGLVSALAILMAIAAVSIAKLSDNLMKETALKSAAQQAQLLIGVQDFYTDLNLIDTQRFIDHNQLAIREGKKHLLAPASFTKEFGQRIDDIEGVPMKAKLYSDYPWYGKQTGMDAFDEFALQKLRRDTSSEFVHNFKLDKDDRAALAKIHKRRGEPVDASAYDPNRVLRYALARKMKGQTCLECHNNSPEAPRRTDKLQHKVSWKEGDVRGALGITRPLDADRAATRSLLWKTVTLVSLTGTVLLGLSVAMLATSLRGRGKPSSNQPG